MNESPVNYHPPAGNSQCASAARPDLQRELRKLRKSVQHLEKQFQLLCHILLESQRANQWEAYYDYRYGINRQNRKRKSSCLNIPDLDILALKEMW